VKLQRVPLSFLAEVCSGGSAPQESAAFSATGHPFVRAGSLSKLLEGASEESLEKLERPVAAKHGLKLFPVGTVLFAKSGMSATKGLIYQLQQPAYVVNHLAALLPHDPADSGFLVRALQRFPPTVLIKDPAYPSIRLGDIRNMSVLAPDDATARRKIADVLDQAESLRVKRRATLIQVDILTQAMFFDLFGDPATNPRRWTTQPLASLVRSDDRINYGVVQPGGDFTDGIPLVRVGDLLGGRVNHASLKRIAPKVEAVYKRSRLRGDEVLVSCVGSIGVVALADESVKGFNIARAVARIPLADATNRVFLASYLNTASVQRYFTRELRTVSQPTLNIKQLSETIVFRPPIELQNDFARRVAAVEKLKAAQRASLAELDALFAGLQHRAFRGAL
jgi:hypothetical protein